MILISPFIYLYFGDIIDNTGLRGLSGIFYKQYKHRMQTSYMPEEYPIKENVINL